MATERDEAAIAAEVLRRLRALQERMPGLLMPGDDPEEATEPLQPIDAPAILAELQDMRELIGLPRTSTGDESAQMEDARFAFEGFASSADPGTLPLGMDDPEQVMIEFDWMAVRSEIAALSYDLQVWMRRRLTEIIVPPSEKES
jgi:hypothetical protein